MGILTHRLELSPSKAQATVEGVPEEFREEGALVRDRDPEQVLGQGDWGLEPAAAAGAPAPATADRGRGVRVGASARRNWDVTTG